MLRVVQASTVRSRGRWELHDCEDPAKKNLSSQILGITSRPQTYSKTILNTTHAVHENKLLNPEA